MSDLINAVNPLKAIPLTGHVVGTLLLDVAHFVWGTAQKVISGTRAMGHLAGFGAVASVGALAIAEATGGAAAVGSVAGSIGAVGGAIAGGAGAIASGVGLFSSPAAFLGMFGVASGEAAAAAITGFMAGGALAVLPVCAMIVAGAIAINYLGPKIHEKVDSLYSSLAFRPINSLGK